MDLGSLPGLPMPSGELCGATQEAECDLYRFESVFYDWGGVLAPRRVLGWPGGLGATRGQDPLPP